MTACIRKETLILCFLLLCQLAIGLYGIHTPMRWGHQGYHQAEHGISARNLIRHGVVTHTTHYRETPPSKSSYNYHHINMQHTWLAAMVTVFGEAPWVARSISVFFTLLAVWGLWALVIRARGLIEATVACAAFVFNPLNGCFCNLPAIQIISIAACLWVAAGLMMLFSNRPGGKSIAIICGFTLLASLHDWPWYPIAFFMFLVAVIHLEVVAKKKWTRRQVWIARLVFVACCLVIAMVFAQHFWRAHEAGQLGNLVGAYKGRSGDESLWSFFKNILSPLSFRHGIWLLAGFALWPVYLLLSRKRDIGTLFVVSIFFGQTVWMFNFRYEFWLHEYRSYWYVPVFAFAAADVSVSAARRLANWISRLRGRPHPAGSLLYILLPGLILVPTAFHASDLIRYSRELSGCIGFLGRSLDQGKDVQNMLAASVIHSMDAREPDRNSFLFVDAALSARLEIFYLLNGNASEVGNAKGVARHHKNKKPMWVMLDAGKLGHKKQWQRLAAKGRVLLLEDVAILDLRPEADPWVEHARLAYAPAWGFVGRFLHAPEPGPRVLVPGEPGRALKIAHKLGLSKKIQTAIGQGQTRFLDSLDQAFRFGQSQVCPAATRTQLLGAQKGKLFEWTCPCGSLLSGLQLDLTGVEKKGNRIIRVQPFCRTTGQEEQRVIWGPVYGTLDQGSGHDISCKPGEWIAAISDSPGLLSEHMVVDCMPKEQDKETTKAVAVCPAGSKASGIHGTQETFVTALGLTCRPAP